MTKKIAIPVTEQGILNAHFGHSNFFELVDVEENCIVSHENMIPPPHQPGVLPKWLAEKGVTDVLAGGMGERALKILKYNNINVFIGAPKLEFKKLVEGFLSNSIEFNPTKCEH